ncbi:MAG: TIGR02186 family protein [Proteobacteria bacterium]|nr:TIGR02186 family protein [Pseudomonadota bacterium]MDA0913601.1 TIGR02186 family protein [Pseudomonadota bacterium]MDA1032528.1 TIGR02186 family protein [Pseudomonadota bacterium]
MRALFVLFAAFFLMGQRDAILVPAVSQDEVQVRQGFTGTELLLYGAILDPRGQRGGAEYDIVVVLKGPTEPITIREKDRIAGVWMNAQSSDFRSAPSFFSVAASRPVEEIVDERTAAIYELGTEFIQLSPTGQIDPERQARFAAGLVDLRQRLGLYNEDMGGVTINEQVLYQARIQLPSNVITGKYTAETFAISDGRVIASAIAEVQVRKVGFERLVEAFSQRFALLYGLLAVGLSVSMGWIAGRLFAMV